MQHSLGPSSGAPDFYFDYNSTSPVVESISSTIRPYITNEFGNPSNKFSPLGKKAKEAIETARDQLAALVGARSDEIVFTSGGTESCFAALVGAFRARVEKRHLIISAVEHSAVGEAAAFLHDMCGIDVSVIPVDRNGELDLDRLFEEIRIDTGVLSFMFANNETGVLFPLREIIGMAHSRGILVHTDAVQGVGRVPLSFKELGVDLLSLTAHKFGGLKGAGALIVRSDTPWEAVVKGGGQEGGRRGGTEAVPQIVAMGEAARVTRAELAAGSPVHLEAVRNFFESTLRERIPNIFINGERTARLPNTSSVRFEGVVAEEIIPVLAKRGIVVSAGSACKTTSVEPSHVLRAMGLSTVECLSAIRFSFGPATTREALLHVVDILCETVAYFRADTALQLRANLR